MTVTSIIIIGLTTPMNCWRVSWRPSMTRTVRSSCSLFLKRPTTPRSWSSRSSLSPTRRARTPTCGTEDLSIAQHWPGRCQGGRAGREASDRWGDGPIGADTAGRADLSHRQPGQRLPQTSPSLIGDLLDMDIGGEAAVPRGLGWAPAPDLLDGGLDQLLAGGPPDPSLPRAAANNLLGNIFGLDSATTSTGYTDRYLKVSGLALSPLRPRRMMDYQEVRKRQSEAITLLRMTFRRVNQVRLVSIFLVYI